MLQCLASGITGSGALLHLQPVAGTASTCYIFLQCLGHVSVLAGMMPHLSKEKSCIMWMESPTGAVLAHGVVDWNVENSSVMYVFQSGMDKPGGSVISVSGAVNPAQTLTMHLLSALPLSHHGRKRGRGCLSTLVKALSGVECLGRQDPPWGSSGVATTRCLVTCVCLKSAWMTMHQTVRKQKSRGPES